MSTTVAPDREQYQAIQAELTDAKQNLYRLQILQTYEDTEGKFGSSGHQNLLSYLSRGKQVSVNLLRHDLAAQTVRVDVLEELLADWEAREDAFVQADAAQGAANLAAQSA